MRSLLVLLFLLTFNLRAQPKPSEELSRIKTLPVHFKFNSSEVIRQERRYVGRLSRALAKHRDLFERIEIVGHSDQMGQSPFNQKLSELRAIALADKLMDAGVEGSQIRALAKSNDEPFVASKAPTAMLLNRRVELNFIGVRDEDALVQILDRVNR